MFSPLVTAEFQYTMKPLRTRKPMPSKTELARRSAQTIGKRAALSTTRTCAATADPTRRIVSRTSREENNRKHQRGCAQTACEYTVRIQYLAKGVYKVQEKGFTYNHEPSQDASAHPSNRRLAVDDQKNIDRLTITGVKV